MVTQADKTKIENALAKLDEFLGSDFYMRQKNSQDTPIEIRRELVKLSQQRSDLTEKLLEIYAKEIEENNAEFTTLLAEMGKVTKAAEEANDELKEVADRIESAIQVAKALDQGVSIAAGLAG